MNPRFLESFHECVQRELGPHLGGPPAVFQAGVATDQYRGLGNAIAVKLFQVGDAGYRPTEFLYGNVPVRNPTLPYLFFQVPVLDIKGNSIPGVAHLAAVVNAPISGTIVAPQVGWRNHYLPFAALARAPPPRDKYEVARREVEVYKKKGGWSPLLEALNADKGSLRAADPPRRLVEIGGFEVALDLGSPLGSIQLAPHRGRTVLTMQRVPSPKSGKNLARFDLMAHLEDLHVVAMYDLRHPHGGEEWGQQIITPPNAGMRGLVLGQIDSGTAPPPPPPPP